MDTVKIVFAVIGYATIAALTGADILRMTASERCSYYEPRSMCDRYHGGDCWGRHINADDPMWVFGAVVWPVALPLLVAYSLARWEPKRTRLSREIARLERENGIGGDDR